MPADRPTNHDLAIAHYGARYKWGRRVRLAVVEWKDGRHRMTFDQNGSAVRLARWLGRRRVASAWGMVQGGDGRDRMQIAEGVIGALFDSLTAIDPISDVLEHIMLTMGLVEADVRSSAFSLTAKGDLVYRPSWRENTIGRVPMDHCEAWRRGRRVVLLVGHNYDGGHIAQTGEHHGTPIRAMFPPWREAPEGVSWYYPGYSTAMLQWVPEVDGEIAPFLVERFGPAPERVVPVEAAEGLRLLGNFVDRMLEATPGVDERHGYRLSVRSVRSRMHCDLFSAAVSPAKDTSRALAAAMAAEPLRVRDEMQRLAGARGCGVYAKWLAEWFSAASGRA